MTKITVGSYNMSFAGDRGLDPRRKTDEVRNVFESEGAFHLSNDTGNPRMFWINALEFVISFWNTKDATAMGLQEMNCTGAKTGAASVNAAMKDISPDIETDTLQCQGGARPCMTIIWKKSVLGNKVRSAIYDLDYTPEEMIADPAGPAHSRQLGRPMHILLTDKKVLLINIHAPNSSNVYTFKDFKTHFQKNLKDFIGEENINPANIIVMGDFNDRYDSLNEIPVGDTFLTYKGKAPLSCCHNWDSACSDSRYNPIDSTKQTGTCTVPLYTEANIGPDSDDYLKSDLTLVGQKYTLAGSGKRILMKEEGQLKNYRYYGDKIFAMNPKSSITIYRPDGTTISTQSDHEMVTAEIEIDVQGGGYRKSRKSKGRKSRKSRKTRTRRY